MPMAIAVGPHLNAHEAAAKLFQLAGIDLRDPNGVIFYREVDDKIIGAFAVTGHGADTVHLHYVGTNRYWITRRLLRAVFTYCFDELAVKVILGFLPPERVYARDVALKLGFSELGIIPGVGIHMMTMTRADCKWL